MKLNFALFKIKIQYNENAEKKTSKWNREGARFVKKKKHDHQCNGFFNTFVYSGASHHRNCLKGIAIFNCKTIISE